MSITITIPDEFFDEYELLKLKALFECSDEEAFHKKLEYVVLAALEEYRDMLLGQGLPSRSAEIREYRLFYLIKHYFNGLIPNEVEVSTMFQLPVTRSRSLLLNVLTRFGYDLEQEIRNTIVLELEKANFSNTDHLEIPLFIQSRNIVDQINLVVAASGKQLPWLRPVRNQAGVYLLGIDTYEFLCKHFGLPARLPKKGKS